jgi:hypothetical protein
MRTREVSSSTRQKIAQAVRKRAASRTEAEKQAIRAKISQGQKRAWATVPKKEEDDEPQVDYVSNW